MNNNLLLYCFIVILFLAPFAYGQYGCPPYGAECPATSRIVLDKLIRDPSKKGEVFVDNLTLSDYHFSPGEEVIFKIIVKNTGNATLSKVDVVDTIPQLTDYVLESGAVRENIREITKTFENFKPDQSEEFLLRVKVAPAEKIPEKVFCGQPSALNRVIARAEGQPEEEDTSAFCIEKKVLGAVEQPAAGTQVWIFALGFLGLGVLGILGKRVFAL